jgi:hypothetical protein
MEMRKHGSGALSLVVMRIAGTRMCARSALKQNMNSRIKSFDTV